MSEKRKRTRAIIYFGDKIATMYREKNDRIFYTFPGGGMEENESEEECVVREVMEEFGMTIKPLKKVYTYENQISIEHFYICEWISGEFGSGEGEEYQSDRNNGVYIPKLVNVSDIPSLPLMPPEVAKAFHEDYTKYGKMLGDKVKFLNGDMK